MVCLLLHLTVAAGSPVLVMIVIFATRNRVTRAEVPNLIFLRILFPQSTLNRSTHFFRTMFGMHLLWEL